MCIKNTSEVTTYNEPAVPSVRVHSHWHLKRLVELEIRDAKGTRIVVRGDELKQAIDNCMNVGR